jgi:dTDP-4-dehydrorhamnose 3,5-epimerase
MRVVDLELHGLKLVTPDVFADDRGFFLETYSAKRYAEAGIAESFVQDNRSRSSKGTLRGLHYQSFPGQAKLVTVTLGRIWDVAVDLRQESATFGKWQAVDLHAEQHEQFFIPAGFAHGFCVLSEAAEVQYKVSAPYDANTECGLRYNDPELAIRWPVERPLLSQRDQLAESFVSFRARLSKHLKTENALGR